MHLIRISPYCPFPPLLTENERARYNQNERTASAVSDHFKKPSSQVIVPPQRQIDVIKQLRSLLLKHEITSPEVLSTIMRLRSSGIISPSNPTTEYLLGWIYDPRRGTGDDWEDSLQALARSGCHLVCAMLKDLPIANRSYSTAFAWYSRSAEGGNLLAVYQVGLYHLLGLGVPKSKAKAIHYFCLAARQNSALALWQLGHLYERDPSFKSNLSKAFEYYCKAAKLGFGKALFDVARCYEQGLGVAIDSGASLSYYEQAAETGYLPAVVNMKNRPERVYADALDLLIGRNGKSPDLTQAVELLKWSAFKGHCDAAYLLGWLWDEERASPRVQEVLRQVSEDGDVMTKARYLLSSYQPTNPMQDDIQAIAWYQQAARDGSRQAEDALQSKRAKRPKSVPLGHKN